jgi:hypothetical protein
MNFIMKESTSKDNKKRRGERKKRNSFGDNFE